MRFTPTTVPGAYVIDLEELADERGFFARVFCREEFVARGLNPDIAQSSVSFNAKRGTLRGLHYQTKPYEEAKVVRCTRGAIFDVVVDMRWGSPAFAQWHGVELSDQNRRMLYIPEGCAHGFLTLCDATEVHYQMSAVYHPESARGVRWDDPALAIRWPIAPVLISVPDLSYAALHANLRDGGK